MSTPRAVIAAPTYNGAAYVEEALGSLLAQTLGDLRVVVVDDASTDDTAERARALAAADPRLEVHVNARRLGMLDNTRHAWALSRERFPQAEFWALGSDHDVWSPAWLERLVAALEARPRAVLAYPLTERIDERGAVVSGSWRFDTEGLSDPRARVRRALRFMVAGDMIYGLARADALDRVGSYRPVLVPDRLLLAELASHGEFVQVHEVLWRRRFAAPGDLDRQRRAFWVEGRAPRSARLPWWLVHAAAAARPDGPALDAGDVLAAGAFFAARQRGLRARNALAGPLVRALLRRRRVRHAVRRAVLPAVHETRTVLERLTEEAER